MNHWRNTIFIILIQLVASFTTFGTNAAVLLKEQTNIQNLICLQSPSRVQPCPNLIYRSVKLTPTTNTNLPNTTSSIFCFCKTDFDKIQSKKVSQSQMMYNKMQWQQILAETNLTEEQLLKMISR